MRNDEVAAMTAAYQMPNYARFPVAFVRGEGARLFDAEGREYLDLLGGIAVAMTAVALGAAWVPARRVTRIQPQQALRCE